LTYELEECDSITSMLATTVLSFQLSVLTRNIPGSTSAKQR